MDRLRGARVVIPNTLPYPPSQPSPSQNASLLILVVRPQPGQLLKSLLHMLGTDLA